MYEGVVKRNYDSKTCMCCMCRCGDHACFHQQVSKLPVHMQRNLMKRDAPECKETEEKPYSQLIATVPENDLYKNTTYRSDFCGQHAIIDHFPLEQKKLVSTINMGSEYTPKQSVSRDDFIPWNKEEQNMCRAKLHVPDHALETVPAEEAGDVLRVPWKITDAVYHYYCPPHCVGDQKAESPKNCLVYHKDRFNLGPPSKRKETLHLSREPFAKFSNYMLDYKKHKMPPKEDSSQIEVKKPYYPMSTETTYRAEYPCPREIQKNIVKHSQDQPGTLKVGDGPMTHQTSSMLDYKDPNVAVHKPVRRPKDIFTIPTTRMETETTTAASYPRWKELPPQGKPKVHKESTDKTSDGDIQQLLTTYQVDFRGINRALCPGTCEEKYGPKILDPRYRFTGSKNKHDFFDYTMKIVQPKQRPCPH